MLGIIRESSHTKTRLVSRRNGRNGNGKLSAKLLDYLESKYQLLPREMLSLRAVRSKGWLGNIPVYFIRIYDREESVRNSIHVKTYHDLDKQPALILYSGYILENDSVYITKYDKNVVYQTS